MDKVTFTKLGLKKENTTSIISFNGNDIEVKAYLPMEEKIAFVQSVLNNSMDDNNFANPMKVDIYFGIEVITRYTNITFIDKQKEDLVKLYDLFVESGLYDQIWYSIPYEEAGRIRSYVDETIDNFYKQQNSAMGIMEKITADYAGLDFDASEIRDKLQGGDLDLLKDVLDKMS